MQARSRTWQAKSLKWMGWASLTACLLVAGGLVLMWPSDSGALPATDVEMFYWPDSMAPEDATMSNYVGFKYRGCNGERIIEGQVTTNKRVVTSEPCAGSSATYAGCYIDGVVTSCSLFVQVYDAICGSSVFTCG